MLAEQTHSLSQEVVHQPCRHGVALVVEGGALAVLLAEEHHREFLTLCQCCQAVICCRVSPIQKVKVLTEGAMSNATGAMQQQRCIVHPAILFAWSCRQRWQS
jgi:magnesium-transporting ATPase (P-type)